MKENQSEFSVVSMSRELQIKPSAYYAWLKRGMSKRDRYNAWLLAKVKEIYEMSCHRYGAPRIAAELRAFGIKSSRNKTAKLMKKLGIKSKIRRKYRALTNSRHKLPVSGNPVAQQFNPVRANKIWASDITYILNVPQIFLYLKVSDTRS